MPKGKKFNVKPDKRFLGEGKLADDVYIRLLLLFLSVQ